MNFGAGLRPIEFPDVSGCQIGADPVTANYWLHYWIRAYPYLLQRGHQGFRLIDFDALCDQPLVAIAALTQELGDEDVSDRLKDAAASFHPTIRYNPAELALDPALMDRASTLSH